ncbi:hypothetical protein R80B4_01390 [Fibrobacteres bacterium R8-0-B4]
MNAKNKTDHPDADAKYVTDRAKETARAKSLVRHYVNFLRLFGFNPQHYRLDYAILKAVVKRYLKDVERLHYFHDITRIDSHKIAGYLTYWLCKLKPIVVDKPQAYYEAIPPVKHLRHAFFINEMFAICVGIGRINAKRGKSCGVTMPTRLFDSLAYELKYRQTNGDTLSLTYYIIDGTSQQPTARQ